MLRITMQNFRCLEKVEGSNVKHMELSKNKQHEEREKNESY